MPISEKDIFASLMQDPNHAYNPLEKVWAEAQQRARQFRNNEKALALAFGDSPALEKLFDYLDTKVPLTKAIHPDSWEQKLIDKWTADTANPDWQTNPPQRSLAWYIKALDEEIHVYNHMPPDEEFPEGVIHLNHPDHPENIGTANGIFETEGVDDQGNPVGQDSREGWKDKHTPGQRVNLRANPDYKVRVPEYSRGSFRRARGDTDIWKVADNLANWRDVLKMVQTGIIQGGQNLQELGAMAAARQGIDNPETWINDFESTTRRLFDEDANISSNVYDTLVAYSNNPKRRDFNKEIRQKRGTTFAGPTDYVGTGGYVGLPHNYDRRGENAPPPPEGNRAHQDYAGLGEDQRALFHEHMVPEDEMDDMDAREFDRRIQHFTQGIQDFADPDERINHWASYRPPEDRRPFRLNLNDFKKHVPRKMKSLMPFDEDGNRTPGYDEEEPEALIPTIGEDETPFNAFDVTNLTEGNIGTSILNLVGEYIRIHEGDGSSAHLGPTDPGIEGQVAYFPANEGQTSLQRYQFDKANFTPQQQREYNKLNTNKAAIEEHLRILFSAADAAQRQDEDEETWKSRILGADGQVKINPWTDHLSDAERRVGGQGRDFSQVINGAIKLLPPRGAPEGWAYRDRNRWYPTNPDDPDGNPYNEDTYVRFNQTPRPGAYDWYQVLNGVAGVGPDGQAAYVDSNGNPSFHTIPQDFLEGLGYAPDADNLDAFYRQVLSDFDEEEGEQPDYGNWFGLRNTDVIARQLIDRAREQAPPEANPWADFTTRVTPGAGDSHRFREAWAKWQADFGPAEGRENPIQTNQLGHFLDWLGYFADSPDVTMTIGGVQHTGKRFTLIPMAYAADPLWHQTEGDEEREDGGGGGEEEREGGGDEEEEETSPFEEEEAEWLREHPDFVGVYDFDEAVRNLSEDEINDYKGQYTQYQENMAAYNEIPDELKQQYGYADWFGMSDEEREQVMNDHVVAQQQAEYDGLSDNLKAKYQTAEEWQNLSPEEKEKAQRRDARTDDVNYILEYKKLTQHMTDAELKREEDFLYDRLDDNAFAKEFATTMKLHGKFREKRRDAEEKATEDEGRKPERTPAEFEKLKADFRRVYEQVHGPLSEDFFDSYSTDYETLDKEYKKALQVEHDRNAKERQTILGDTANNVGGPDGIDPLPNPPTQDDLLHQVRHIQMWKQHHGPYMTDKKAKDALNQLEIEAYQKANNAGIDLEGLIDKDKEDAKNNGLAYGSSKWFETIGKTHVDEQMKGARYRRQIQRGGELRSNSNYKPWLVIQYDRDGNGTLLDLRSGQEVRREDLRFDKENSGFDYTGSKDKPQLADPESSFWENLDYANLRPIHTDEVGRRTPIEPPEIGHSPKQGRGRAWYHPESKSWINSHRYNDALEELRGAAPGSGMLINIGSGYHGTNQSGDAQRHYGFQTTGVPGSGSEKSYYIDGQGNIVHIDPDASHKLSSPDFSQPQTVNSAIHDWHLSHIQTQATANPGWGLENNQPKTHVIMSPQQQQGPMPLQNAVQEGDALYRRRQKGKSYGKRGFDRLYSDELGMEPTYYGKRGRMQMLTPRTATEKLKQGFIGTVGYTESGVLTGLAKLLLNTANFGTLGLLGLGWGQEQKNIQRQRANYNRQSKLQRNVKQHMETVTDNGRQRAYLSPGEEDARRQDHKSLQDAYSVKQAEWQNRAREYKNAGDRDGGARAEAESIRFQGLKQSIDKRKVENPADWEHINSLYEQHYGSPQVQATLAPAIGEQASQNIADRFQPLPQQPSQSGETYPMMYDETPSQPRELEPIWS